jgi:hypothetical protein
MDDELRQMDLETEFPGWQFTIGVNQLPQASRPMVLLSGEDWTDLRGHVRRFIAAGLEAEFPDWRFWLGVNAVPYGRRLKTSPANTTSAASWPGLGDKARAWQVRREG